MLTKMHNTINSSQQCRKVKFKSNRSHSTQNGSNCHEQNKCIIKSCNCQPSSFPKFDYLLTFLLLLSYCTLDTEASAVDDLYRSRSKRYAQDEETTTTPEIPITNRPDTICNQGGRHECVCNRSLGDLDDKLLLCDRLLEVILCFIIV